MASLEIKIKWKKLKRQIAFCKFILKVCQVINKVTFGLVDKLNLKYRFLEKFCDGIIGRKIL
jgi:hypothetical protein